MSTTDHVKFLYCVAKSLILSCVFSLTLKYRFDSNTMVKMMSLQHSHKCLRTQRNHCPTWNWSLKLQTYSYFSFLILPALKTCHNLPCKCLRQEQKNNNKQTRDTICYMRPFLCFVNWWIHTVGALEVMVKFIGVMQR